MAPSKRVGFTLVELLVVTAIIAVLVAILLPAVQAAREASRRTQCRNNLHQIGIAMHNYHDAFKLLPPGWIGVTNNQIDVNGKSGFGWAALIIPMMEERAAFMKINAKVSLTDASNATIRVHAIPNYRCPSDSAPETWSVQPQSPTSNPDLPVDVATSNYIASYGTTDYHTCASNPIGTPCAGDGVFFLDSHTGFADIRDQLGYTLMVGERKTNLAATPPIIGTWVGAPPGGTESIACVLGSADYGPNDPLNPSAPHIEAYSSAHAGGAHFLLCDGRVQFISEGADLKLFQGLATINKRDDTIVFQQ